MPTSSEQGLAVHTRNNWPIPNETAPEKNAVSQQASIELWRELLPDAKLRSISATYNCMGMVFASRRSHIHPKYLRKILKDDGYRPVQRTADVEVGDVVVYLEAGDVSHVGIVVTKKPNIEEGRIDFDVMSKWGHDGEYIHDLHDVPSVFGKELEFYTDRRALT